MSSLPLSENILWFASTTGYAAVAIRLLATRLFQTYPGFFTFLVFRTLRGAGLRLLDPGREAYAWAWMLTEPLVWILTGYAAYELSSMALREYRGLASLSRKTLVSGLMLCVLAAVATLVVDVSHSRGDFPVLLAINLARRAIWSVVVLYLLLVAGFLLWFPVPVTRNVLLHTLLLAVYSLAETAMLFVRNLLGPSAIEQVSTAILAASVLCLAGWLSLTRAGEHKPALLRMHWKPETERELLEQLSALNTSLSRSAGKRPASTRPPA